MIAVGRLSAGGKRRSEHRLIVIPLMVVLEIAQANGWLQNNRYAARPFRAIGVGEEGVFPLVVAIVFGITYGSA